MVAPTANPVNITIAEDATETRTLLKAVDNPDGTGLSFENISSTKTPGFILGADGAYTIDTTNAAYQRLAAGQSETLTVDYRVTNKDGSSVSKLNFTVTGTNDAPVASDLVLPIAINEGDAFLGDPPAAVDPDQNDSLSFAAAPNALGFAMNGNGAYTIDTSAPDYASLAAGQVKNFTVAYSVTDGSFATDQGTITYQVRGVDDLAVIAGDRAATILEAATAPVTGTLTITDVDATTQPGFVPQTNVAGLYGTFSVDAAGKWSYAVDNTNPKVLALTAGATLKEVLPVVANDGTGVASDVTITISGVDTPAVITGIASGTVTEDATLIASGMLAVSDIDSPTVTGFVAETIQDAYGTFAVTADGSWTYVLDNASPTVQALDASSQIAQSYFVKANGGSTVEREVIITINGANENSPPVAQPDTALVIEDAALATGTVAKNDSDVDNDTLTFSLVNPAPAGFTFAADGSWTFDPTNPAYQFLNDFTALQVTIPYQVSDGKGGIATSSLKLTVQGVDDPAQISGVVSGAVTEDLTLIATGKLTVTDVDTPVVAGFVADTINDKYGTFSITADGTWTYLLDNASPDVQALTSSSQIARSFFVKANDGTAAQREIIITINGADENRPPVAQPDTLLAIEDSGLIALGTVATNDSDPDAGAILTYKLDNGPIAGLTFNANGSYSFSADGPEYQSLRAGVTKDVVANYTVTDQFGASATSTLTITVRGTNDMAVIGAPSVATVTEDVDVLGNLIATGTIPVTDVDADETGFQTAVTSAAGNLGQLVLNANGTYSYSVANSAVQFLGATATKVETFTIKSIDGTEKVVTFTINGRNDVPVIGKPSVDSVIEDKNVDAAYNLTAKGTIAIADADLDQSAFLTIVTPAQGNLGSLVLAADGSYTYTVANAATQHLNDGQSKVDSFTVKSVDGTEKVVDFTIFGANEPQPTEKLYYDDKHQTQWLTGSTTKDVFVIDGLSKDYGAGPTQDGKDTVVWSGTQFDILKGFEVLRFNDRDVLADANGKFQLSGGTGGNGGTKETLFDNVAGTQWLTGTSNNDVFVVHGNSKDFGAGRTQDGQGTVVWSGKNFDILKGFEVLRFDDRDVHADANGQFNLTGGNGGNSGGTKPDVLHQNTTATQWINGTAAANDIFVVGARETGYGYSKTQDGTGIVVWKGTSFDILHDVEVIRFADHDVLTSSII